MRLPDLAGVVAVANVFADPAAGPGEQCNFSMLTPRRRGGMASVDVEGEPQSAVAA